VTASGTLRVEDKAEPLVAFDRPGTRTHPFMFHCHILEHEEAGLMGQYVCTQMARRSAPR
jgi:FtsP/CotA-like multicopper oxidase with cupredoxin domain